MAFKNFEDKCFSLTRDLVKIDMSIPTNGATTPVASTVRGPGYTVARTGEGVYTLTPIAGMRMPVQLGIIAHLRLASVGNTFAQVGTYVEATGVIVINCVNGSGTGVEWPNVNANNVLSVSISFSSSAGLPNRS